MNDEHQAIVLAGLFHDVGKVFQRAGWDLPDRWHRTAEALCPVEGGGRFAFQHVLFTREFFEHHADWLSGGPDRGEIERLASGYHKPTDFKQQVISEADRLASGLLARRAAPDETEHVHRVFLSCGFSRLEPGSEAEAAAATYMPGAIGERSASWPQYEPAAESLQSQYQRIAAGLLGFLSQVGDASATMLQHRLGWYYEAFLSAVPASTSDEVDVPLGDHARLVAAFSIALYRYLEATRSQNVAALQNAETEKLLLVTATLTGGSEYLHMLPTSGPADGVETLAGRTFYLWLLGQMAGQMILDRLDLPVFNLVYQGGPSFTFLTDNTELSHDPLGALGRDLDEWFRSRFAGLVTLSLGEGAACKTTDFLEGRFRELHSRTKRGAPSPLGAALRRDGAWLEDHQVLRDRHGGAWESEHTELARTIGRALRRAQFVAVYREGRAPSPGLLSEPVDFCGYRAQLFERAPADHSGLCDVRRIAAPDQPDHVPEYPLRYVVMPPPEAPERQDGSGGTIGVLRARVDRFDFLLSEGQGKETSIGRTAALRRQLSRFFDVIVPQQCGASDSGYDRRCVVYGQGEGLLGVGPAATMMTLASDLCNWWTEYTAGNPNLTISAGLAFASASSPIGAAVAEADQLLRDARRAGKAGIGIFDEVFQWPHYQQGLGDGAFLAELLGADGKNDRLWVGRPFAGRLLDFARAASAGSGPDGAVNLKALGWRSRMTMDFRRSVELPVRRRRLSAQQRDDLKRLRRMCALEAGKPSIRHLRIASSYALQAAAAS